MRRTHDALGDPARIGFRPYTRSLYSALSSAVAAIHGLGHCVKLSNRLDECGLVVVDINIETGERDDVSDVRDVDVPSAGTRAGPWTTTRRWSPGQHIGNDPDDWYELLNDDRWESHRARAFVTPIARDAPRRCSSACPEADVALVVEFSDYPLARSYDAAAAF